MKKIIFYFLSLFLPLIIYSQSGINTKLPKATLDVVSKSITGLTPEGLITPRLSGEVLHTADNNNVYGEAQDGTLIFVTTPPSIENRVGQTIDIDIRGFYFYDFLANKWINFSDEFLTPNISTLDCYSMTFLPLFLLEDLPYTGVLKVGYTGGNGVAYPQRTFTSNGLVFKLYAGNLAKGDGNFVFNVTGTPEIPGEIFIPIVFGEVSCNIVLTVDYKYKPIIMPGNTKAWMRHNLGAKTNLDPDVPQQAIFGNYYQWGRIQPVANAFTSKEAIVGWNTTNAPNNALRDDIKTANDPCPKGFRMPTKVNYDALIANTTTSNIGTWSTTLFNFTNFGVAKVLASNDGSKKLTFPAAGNRLSFNGELRTIVFFGNYWSSTYSGDIYAHYLQVKEASGGMNNLERTIAFSFRCIEE